MTTRLESLLDEADSLVRADGTIVPGYESSAAIHLGEIVATRRAEQSGVDTTERPESPEYPADIAISFGESSIDTFHRVFSGLVDLVVTLAVDGTDTAYVLDGLVQVEDDWAFMVTPFDEGVGEGCGEQHTFTLAEVDQITIH